MPTIARKEARRPMPDPRWDALAETLIQHSTRLGADETLLIECFDLEDSTLPRLLVQKAARRGANPLVDTDEVTAPFARQVLERLAGGGEP